MIRGALHQAGVGAEKTFRWRGGEVTRIEGFTDAVFAFAITLLVVSLEVPATFAELMQAMRGFPAFAVCFWILMSIWYNHYLFFRRYGIQDGYSLVLNAVLIFLVLFYVYPLKFLWTTVFGGIFGISTGRLHAGAGPIIGAGDVTVLFLVYNVGFMAVWSDFALLYLHALRRRSILQLDPVEVLHTKESLYAFLVNISVALLSSLVAVAGGARLTWLAGSCYFLIGPARTVLGRRMGAARRRLLAAQNTPS
jgi:uncharacterized membrane protein